MAECRYLGHRVSSGKVAPKDLKVEAIKLFTTPQTKKQVRSFRYSGVLPQIHSTICITCYSTHRPHSEICTKQGGVVTLLQLGIPESEERSPIFKSPDFTKEFVLQTDASDGEVGAVLSQCDKQGQDRPVAYIFQQKTARP